MPEVTICLASQRTLGRHWVMEVTQEINIVLMNTEGIPEGWYTPQSEIKVIWRQINKQGRPLGKTYRILCGDFTFLVSLSPTNSYGYWNKNLYYMTPYPWLLSIKANVENWLKFSPTQNSSHGNLAFYCKVLFNCQQYFN